MYASAAFGAKAFGTIYSPAESGVSFTVSGIERGGFLTKETLKVFESVNSRTTLSCNLIDKDGAYLPTEGEEVIFKYNGVRIFAGSIEKVGWDSRYTTGRFISLSCVNKARVLDRRLVARAFTNMATEAIVQAVITDYLAADGITAGVISPGPIITKAVFNYVTASKLMDDLADLTGYSWTVDQYGQLQFTNRTTQAAPWDISNSSAPVFGIVVNRSRQNYANRQWLRAGQDETDSRTESFKGDGTRQTFTVKFPVATAPTITVNAVSKTVGIRQLETGKDFYWNKSNAQITQDDSGTPLTTSDTLAITYTGFYPLIVKVQDDAEIAARALIEGGSGLYERIDTDQSIEDRDLASDKAAGLLRKYGEIQETVSYGSYTFGIRAGQLQNIVRTEDAINGNFLIAETTITWSAPREGFIIQVKALSGEQLGGWQDFFKALFATGNKFTIRENEVVLQAITQSETLLFTDAFDWQKQITAPPSTEGTGAAPSTGSDDPYTTAWVSDATQEVGHQFRVGVSRVGRDYFS